MKKELKNNLDYRKTMLILSALCISSGLLSLIISEVAIVLAASLLAAIFLYEEKGSNSFSLTVSILLVVINIASFLIPDFIPSFWSLASIAIAFVMQRAYSNMTEKAETALIMTVIVSVSVLLSAIATPMMIAKELNFDIVRQFYGNLVETLRQEIVSGWELLLSQIPSESANGLVSTDDILTLFNHQINMTLSYVIIFSFFIVGAAFKIFTFIVAKCSENPSDVFLWRFKTSNIFAYFYLILSFATVFIVDLNSTFGITAYNLYNIFLFVYFYIGFNFAVQFLARKRSPKIAFLLVSILVIIFFTYAIEILAIIGAFQTIRSNSAAPKSV